MLVFSLCFVSCGDDDNEDLSIGGSNGDNTEIKGDYTATASVKTLTLSRSYGIGEQSKDERTIYEDFNNLYSSIAVFNLSFPFSDISIVMFFVAKIVATVRLE